MTFPPALRAFARPEALSLLPAALLAGVWLGGEGVLIAAAVAAPLLCAGLARAGATDPRDGTTGLRLEPGLVAALDAAFVARARSGRTTVALAVGLDDFAEIAARHGPGVSDEVERRAGERLRSMLRRDDTVARLGPGLYGVALAPVARADLETALQAAGRLQAAVREPILAGPLRIHVSCSVGFCLAAAAPRPSGEAALAAARDALAEAQAAGAGAVRAFTATRARRRTPGAATPEEAAEALEAGLILPWFQPQLSTETGAVSGIEALARWQHPGRGVIGPREFLPALAAAGRLERLGEVMLFHGLSAMRDWDAAGIAVPTLGVNFSQEELRDPRLADRLAWELDRFGLAPSRLTVEILETVMVAAGDDSVSRTIEALAKLGCRIDLDDFGTGNASIAALRRFDVRRIKIDRSFVINVDADRDQQLMITAILGFAERLGLETLAEGVEGVAEHAILAQLGCGHVQGYGIARPMPFEDTVGWLQAHAARIAAAPAVSRRAG